MAGICEFAFVPEPHLARLWLGPAIVMCVALLAGPGFSTASAAVFCGAAFLGGSISSGEAALLTIPAVFCGEFLRRGVTPAVVAGVQFVAAVAARILASGDSTIVAEVFVWAACHAGATIAVATVPLVLIPRRSRQFAAHCRVRWSHFLFAFVAGTWSTAGLFLLMWRDAGGSQSLSAAGTWPLLPFAFAPLVIAVVLVLRLKRFYRGVQRQASDDRSLRSEGARRAVAHALPGDIVHRILNLTRENKRLRRDAERRACEAKEAQETIARLEKTLGEINQTVELRARQARKLFRGYERTNARLQALMRRSLDVTLFADDKGVIQSVSRSAMRVLGFMPAQLEGQHLSVLIPPLAENGHPLDVNGRTPADPPKVAIVNVQTADGKTKPVRAHVHAYAIGNRTEYAVQLHDNTGMRKALAALEQARDVSQSTRKSRDHFIATMSHELRTPLHGLIATLDMLRPGPECPPEFEQRLSIARLSARSLLKIANDILDLTRFDSGRFHLESKPFSLQVTLQGIMDESRARADALG
ncbi:MAG TPA: histidine kinase dimerization/phospho-acceptor domain-containing protein, partial [Steroidobacteraceae bacterium]